MIELSHISKTYIAPDKNVIALEDVNIQVGAGQIYGIVGYSGAGKSTLVRCINFLERPDSGSIRIDGFGTIEVRDKAAFHTPEGSEQAVRLTEKHLKTLRRDLGMIFQHFNLLDRNTVFENVAYPLKYNGLSKEEIRDRVLEMLDLVDLRDKVNAYPSELSGGQKQRVAIARALAMKPEVILFDEPTSALDPTMVGEVLSVIRQLAKEGLTMLIVTHEMKFAHDVSTRLFFMSGGYIHEDGSPEQIFDAPIHSATKAFIQRIRKEVFEIDGPDFDFLGMHSTISAFCHKYGISEKEETAHRLVDQMLDGVMTPYRPITVRITHSEQSLVTALDFMVEQMAATPLDDAQRSELSGQCRQVVEEETKRGFRIKLILN